MYVCVYIGEVARVLYKLVGTCLTETEMDMGHDDDGDDGGVLEHWIWEGSLSLSLSLSLGIA